MLVAGSLIAATCLPTKGKLSRWAQSFCISLYVHPINHSQLTLNTNHDRFQATSKKSSKEAQNMTTSNWFDDQPVLGKLPPEQAAAKLREIGENEAADMLEMTQDAQSKAFEIRGRKSWWPFQDTPWQH